jgi:hypothetical protein
MSKDEVTVQGRKLSTVRRLLWIVFGGISIPLALLWIPFFVLVENLDALGISPPPGFSSPMLLYMTVGFQCVLIVLTGAVCLLIYNIYKYRLEKDEDFFL